VRTELTTTTFDDLVRRGVLLVSDGYRAKNDELGGDGPIFLRAGHVSDTHIDFAGVERFHAHLASRVAAKASAPGDTIITTKGNSTGRTAFVKPDMPTFIYSPHLSFWRVLDASAVEPRFLRAWSDSEEFQTQLRAMAASTDMAPYLSLVDQRRLRITLPPIRTQRAIATVLGALDDKIDLNRRMNETLEETARALFRSWFVDFDPVRAKAEGRQPFGMDAATAALFPDGFEESELGDVPRGWRAVPVSELATYINGAAYSAFQPNDDRRGLPIIKIAELKAGVTAQTKFSDVAMHERYRIDRGEVLFSWSGNPDTSIDTFVWPHGPAWLNQHIFRVVTPSAEERSFVLAMLKSLRPVFAEIARNKQTTGLGHVTAADMRRLLVVRPDPGVVRAWHACGGPLLAKSFANDLESATLATLRDYLLPKLLSGEVRVRDAEKLAEAAAR
jgi:type I restriction enzyme S subunit